MDCLTIIRVDICIILILLRIINMGGYFMKDGLICGLFLGLMAGALLYKHNPQAKEIVNESEKAVKRQLKNITSK